MAYLALARKHRPSTFEEVIGQEPIVTALRNILAQRRVHHAYLFAGIRGIGKTTTARLLAKALNCADGPTATPCNKCQACVEASEGRAVDTMEIDGASSGGVDQIRELREIVRYTPFRDRYKVVIIDEVHMVTTAAFNALLKTLEEPPPYIVFIFATTDYRKVPATILSRCLQFYFRPLTIRAIADHLRSIAQGEKVKISDKALIQIAKMAGGSSRDSISLLDQVIAYCGTDVKDSDLATVLNILPADVHVRLLKAVVAGEAGVVLEQIGQVVDAGGEMVNFLRDFQSYLRQLLIVKASKSPEKLLDTYDEEIETLMETASLIGEEADLLRLLNYAMQIEANLRFVHNPRHLVEAGFLNMCQFKKLVPIAEAYKVVEHAVKGRA